ncbi:unnamed protein product [Dovyalis caffra]|uniref:Ionotropic glutamate receptor C-terminal domain-containing protein n=1 Tax=Dovyalis caffra TaxID=77055 RepID=A0AAV1S1D2_9ROSI|nr:unnamed protein product [Dovyalis caffra]
MKNEEVHAIIGPQKSSQAKFVIELGGKAQVPIVSFSATSPTLSATQSKYFVRTAQDDSSQVKAIAAIVQAFGWREIVPIYEDTEYGNGLVPYLLDAFQEIDTRVPYGSSIPLYFNDTEIMRELNKLKAMQKSIFLVHMSSSLGSRLFVLAKDAGMMSEGYAWLVTAGLSSLLDPVGSEVKDSMQGVLGVRPHIPVSKKLENFKSRWRNNFTTSKTQSKISELNLFGLWAYDTVWAMAMAVEKARIVHSRYLKPNTTESTVDIAALGTSEMGPKLLSSILSTRFQGLSGDFHLTDGEMIPSAFEILNVIGRAERVIGYWTPERGLMRSLHTNGKMAYSTSENKLKEPIWPGDTTQQPKKLRIGIPLRSGFSEFIKVEWHPESDKPTVSGFSCDVFLAVVDALPFPLPYKFIPFVNNNKQSAGTYNELLYQIKLKSYTANLASMLTVQRLQPTFDDVKEIRKNGYFVGHQKNSFVKDFLMKQLNFSDTKLREYSTPEEYHEALSNGTHNGGVAAIFAEIPYVKLFLAKYCSKYQTVGPTYKTDGFGFAFPLGSPLVPYISRAVLNVTQDKDKMEAIEQRNFGRETTCLDQASENPPGGLRLSSFGGLFIITGVASMSALLIYIMKFLYCHWPDSNTTDQERSFYLRILELTKRFGMEDPSVHHISKTESRVHAEPSLDIIGASPNRDDAHNHSRTSSEASEDIIEDQDQDNLTPGRNAANSEAPDIPKLALFCGAQAGCPAVKAGSVLILQN